MYQQESPSIFMLRVIVDDFRSKNMTEQEIKTFLIEMLSERPDLSNPEIIKELQTHESESLKFLIEVIEEVNQNNQ